MFGRNVARFCIPRPVGCTAPPRRAVSFLSLQERVMRHIGSTERVTPPKEITDKAANLAARRNENSLFERVRHLPVVTGKPPRSAKKPKSTDLKRWWEKPMASQRKVEARTERLKISPRKLTMLAHQISGKPIDYALLQMKFSEKRASKHVQELLENVKTLAVKQKMQSKNLVVSEAWVGKCSHTQKRLDIKGRGRMGIRKTRFSHLHIVLRRGLTYEDRSEKARRYKLNRIRSAGLVPENAPIRNVRGTWGW